jgi:hypothetical protein
MPPLEMDMFADAPPGVTFASNDLPQPSLGFSIGDWIACSVVARSRQIMKGMDHILKKNNLQQAKGCV